MPRLPGRAVDRAAAAILAIHAVIAWLLRAPGVLTSGDDATYILLARALRAFSYRESWMVGAPLHSLYPPGYPAALALWGLPFGDRFDALVVLNIAASVGTLAIIYVVIKRLGFPSLALLAIGALSVNTGLMGLVTQVRSEPVAVFWSVLAISQLVSETPSTRALWVAGVASILASLTRTASLAALAAVMCEFLVSRRWRAAALLGGAACVTVGLWFLFVMSAPNAGESYVTDLMRHAPMARSFLAVAAMRVRLAAEMYLGNGMGIALGVPAIPGTAVDNVIAALVMGPGLLVGLVVFWRRWRVAALQLVLMAMVLTAWTWKDPRFLLSVSVLLVPMALTGIWTIAARIRPAAALPAAAVVTLVLVAGGSTEIYRRGVIARRDCVRSQDLPAAACVIPDIADYFEAVAAVRALTPASAVVLNVKSSTLFYYTGRRGVNMTELDRAPVGEFLERLRAGPATWVLLGSIRTPEPLLLAPRLAAACSSLTLVRTFAPRTFLFRLRQPGETGDDAACRAIEQYQRSSYGRDWDFWPFL